MPDMHSQWYKLLFSCYIAEYWLKMRGRQCQRVVLLYQHHYSSKLSWWRNFHPPFSVCDPHAWRKGNLLVISIQNSPHWIASNVPIFVLTYAVVYMDGLCLFLLYCVGLQLVVWQVRMRECFWDITSVAEQDCTCGLFLSFILKVFLKSKY